MSGPDGVVTVIDTVPAACAGVVARTLPKLLADPANLVHRNDMLYGAYLAGAALTGGFALQHAVAHMLGGSFGVEHGTAHAVMLPYVTAHLVRMAPEPLGRIAAALETDDPAGFIWDLVKAAGLPVRLADVGVHDLERAVEIAMTAEEHDEDNPAPVTEAAVREILEAAARGDRPMRGERS